VPFSHLVVAGLTESGDVATPLVVRAAPSVHFDSGYISALGGEACPLAFVWHAPAIRTWVPLPTADAGAPKAVSWEIFARRSAPNLLPFDSARFTSVAREQTPQDLPLAVHDAAACADALPAAVGAPPPPSSDEELSGAVAVLVILNAEGTIAKESALVETPDADVFTERSALGVAARLSYRAERFRCREAWSAVVVPVTYAEPPPDQ
jgi:hypothetical protein